MKFKLVSTTNTMAIMDAADAVSARLADSEIMGLGLIFGRPGLGKTATLEAFAARSAGAGLRVVFVRAMRHWTESSMLKALLLACGQAPDGYRKDLMFDQLEHTLKSNPAVFILDEVDAIAGKTTMIGMLKDIHDVTRSAILMVGEERVDAILRRYASFYNRVNQAALLQVGDHCADDVALVIAERCDCEVDDDVCDAIHAKTGGKSMRSVIDEIRDMETHARANDVSRISMADYRRIEGERKRGSVAQLTRPAAVPLHPARPEAING
jgi:Cdc6-like AAA superfamily ATPase